MIPDEDLAATVDSDGVPERFLQRKQTVQKMCNATYRRINYRQRWLLYNNLIVNDNYKLIFCVVPKAGCTSWKRVLLVMSGKLDSVDSVFIVHNRSQYRYLSSYGSKSEIDKRLNTYTKFMVSREPLSRFISAYVDKFGNQKNPLGRLTAWRATNGTKTHFGFAEFLQFVVNYAQKKGAYGLNPHWRPATLQCQPCTVDYDFYSTVSTANEDADFILKFVDAPQWLHLPHAHLRNSTDRAKALLSQLTPSLLQNFDSVYRDDYNIFGYDKPVVHMSTEDDKSFWDEV
jgi:hypothetical protein